MSHLSKALLPVALLFFTSGLGAQDVHFSHMDRAPLHLNPALSGLSRADYRFGGIYRNQWQAVPVPYTSVLAFADGRFSKPKIGPGFFGAGLQVLSDEAGDGEMRWVQAAASVSYLLPLGRQFGLSAGVQGSFAQRSFLWSRLTFDEQFDGDQFNAGSPTGEDFSASSLAFPSLAVGFNLRFKTPESRTQADLGTGVHHLFKPVSSFFDTGDSRISRRLSPYFLAQVQMLPKLDLVLRIWWMSQEPYTQLVAGGGLLYHLNTSRGKEVSLELSLTGRLNDALIPQAGLRYRSWEAGFSYDINTSDFQVATNRRGGTEFYLQYFITRVQAPPVFKACPLF